MKKTAMILTAIIICLSWPDFIRAYQSFPDTGQSKCYNNTEEITCPDSGPFYGQDAHYQPRVPQSYTKLGYGGEVLADNAVHVDDGGPWIMTRDNVTGLIWEVKTEESGLRNNNNTYTWYDPDPEINKGDAGEQNGGQCSGSDCDTYSYIQALNQQSFGGCSDWRMPGRQELSSLANRDDYAPSIDTQWFPHTRASNYWTGDTFAMNNVGAWRVDFFHALVGGADKRGADKPVVYHARAVRGGPSEFLPHLTDNQDGTVTDHNTGLVWQKCSHGQTWDEATNECSGTPTAYNWQDALAAAESLRWANHTDWRLPDINELQTLIDDTTSNPAILDILADDTISGYYWSSTTYPGSMDRAWSVYFLNGFIAPRIKTNENNYYVRAVRGGDTFIYSEAKALPGLFMLLFD
ncbi:MAG: DUF1566 domain-containing protein [Desulfobacterales bacterium]|nr:DUF1566 domain-containing protein [Desulfobacterales bacterium]